MFDGIVIGGGIVGCALAEALGGYEGKWLLLEAEEDVAVGASKANSGIVHAGFDAIPGTLKAIYNIAGAQMYASEAKRFGVPYRKNGALVAAFDEKQVLTLRELMRRGELNGTQGLQLLGPNEVKAMENSISSGVLSALYAPTSALVSPYEMTAAYASYAADLGVEFVLNSPAEKISHSEGVFTVTAGGKSYTARSVINCAGCGGAKVREMMSQRAITITPRRGQYLLYDRAAGCPFTHTVFQTPGEMGKGVLVTPTVHGNLLIGPTAEEIGEPLDTATTSEGLDRLLERARLTYPSASRRDVITAFAGVRAHEAGGVFLIGDVPGAPEGAFEAVGIESPGITAAPAIARTLAARVAEYLKSRPREHLPEPRPLLKPFREMTAEEKQAAWERDPRYGSIVCRCEEITEAEIVDAIHRSVGARSLDGVKRRTRAGMGRCQGGFCSTRVMEILAQELGMDLTEITKCGGESRLVTGRLGSKEVPHEY